MTEGWLEKVRIFAQPYYKKLDQFHDKRHAELTLRYALRLAKQYPHTNIRLLTIACLLHDIGRVEGDVNHAYKSAELVKPFLKKIGLMGGEIAIIIDAIYNHNVKDIRNAKTIEAKLLFDADKIQQISVYGFLRACLYVTVLDHIDFLSAIDNRYEKVRELWPHIQTPEAKKLLEPQIEKVAQIVNDFQEGSLGNL